MGRRTQSVLFLGITLLVGAVSACTASATVPPNESPVPESSARPLSVPTTPSVDPPAATVASESSEPVAEHTPTPGAPTVPAPGPSVASTATPSPEITATATPTQTNGSQATSTPTASYGGAPGNSMFGPISCDSSAGDIKLTNHIYPPDQFDALVPMGRMWDSHVTPTDHLYVRLEQEHPRGMVSTPADGRIIKVERFSNDQSPFWDPSQVEPDNRVIVAHSCDLFSIYIHLGELAPEIAAVVGDLSQGGRWNAGPDNAIQVSAGDPIARFGGSSIDYSLHDGSVVLQGFQVADHYKGEPWKVHTVDPFDYMTDEIESDLLAKNERTVAPFGGQIDYDVPGTLAGNWFMDGTVDYRGNGSSHDYWNGHLAIAYDHIDPAQLRISIGRDVGITHDDCRVCGGVYAVSGNSPNPASITVVDGLIKYELTGRQHASPDSTEATVSNGDLLGTFLAQVLDDTSMKTEFFKDLPASQVIGFTANAIVYRR